jgi:tetratricopeptide (TPR) repeat protein
MDVARDGKSRPEIAGLYKKGDVIGGKYVVERVLGKGGFGIVYLVYAHDVGEMCALKTFRDELLASPIARDAFKKEALLWVNLDRHPFILGARWVEEISGRLFVEMDYVEADAKGRVSLADYLVGTGTPVDSNRMLEWAIQFCLGIEHARAHGIECHRDIKPANILITNDGTLKITDFGLSLAAEAAWRRASGRINAVVTNGTDGNFGFSLMQSGGKRRCGTPGYIAPEVYRCEGADVRSDIYSFGLVLWQMANGSRTPPFIVRWRENMDVFLQEIYDQQMTGYVPPVQQIPLKPVIERCLQPQPTERYGCFEELRKALQPIWEAGAARKFENPQVGERTASFWVNKGAALCALKRGKEAIGCFGMALAIDSLQVGAWIGMGYQYAELGQKKEAIECYDIALAIDPRDATAWNNKGNVLSATRRHEEAIRCYDQSLAIDPRYGNAWNNKGIALEAISRHQEAIACYNKALAIDQRATNAWNNKGGALVALGRYEEAIHCFDNVLMIDPQNAAAFHNKGISFREQRRYKEAVGCFDEALALDPRYADAWNNKGIALVAIDRREEAIDCFDKVLMIDPRYTDAWNNKGKVLELLGRRKEAIGCYDHILEIDSRCISVWHRKGNGFAALGRYAEAIACYDKVLGINPREAETFYNKGNAVDALGRHEEALACYDQALAINSRHFMAWCNKGASLIGLGRFEAAVACFEQALTIKPKDAACWINKATAEDGLKKYPAAARSYRQFIELAPTKYAAQITHARQRLQELESKRNSS